MECNHLRANDTAGSESQQRQELIFLEELAKLASDKMKKIGKGESMTSSNDSAGVKVSSLAILKDSLFYLIFILFDKI